MPSLPPELERLIFEMAALQDTDHDSRVRIILVAKRVCEWIRPILYRVAIDTRHEGIRNWRNAQITDVAPFTQHLLLLRHATVDFLSTFHNIENLAIWCSRGVVPNDLENMNDLPLRMLSFVLDSDEAITYYPAFRNITHLELSVSLQGSIWNRFKALVELPKLTHLSLDVSIHTQGAAHSEILRLLEHCTSLRAMIYLLSQTLCTIETDDPRFLVFRDHMDLDDLIAEWERSANGQIGLWELADMIIEARKDKLFKNNSLFNFSRKTWMDDLNEEGMGWYLQKCG